MAESGWIQITTAGIMIFLYGYRLLVLEEYREGGDYIAG